MTRRYIPLPLLLIFCVSCLATGTNPGAAGPAGSGSPVKEDTFLGTSPSGATGPSGGDASSGGEGEDTASNQPGPGGSMPTGIPAPGVDVPGGFTILKAAYKKICQDSATDKIKISFEGGVTSTWPLTPHPEVCTFGGKQALRVVFPVDPAVGLRARGITDFNFVDVPVGEGGHVSASLWTTSPEEIRGTLYLKEKAGDAVSPEMACPNKSCVDTDQNGDADAGYCQVVTLEFLEGAWAEIRQLGPLPSCSQALVERAVLKTAP